ncbi:cysteine hydrolase family protein [Streptomyces sp. CBMA29]|uniref:cysteine hydrolase family protein n=1 Tax=Streptomyces sp. CBMA29 TaxID=1896314 RepID=UPI001661DA50|nr:cysteine hydrolase [Streptomyces sp. CBMA29]MBD0740640.1 isochorismatase [Streptomyces sp. CBMA29]
MSASRTALLVMDFQNGIVQRIADDSVVAAAARAVEAARAADIPVIFVRVAFRPGYPETAASNLSFSALSQAGDAFTQDNPATQVVDALAPRADEPVAVKRRVSAFTGSDLEVLLRGAGADSLVLTGLSTSGVVLSTIRQAADLDYRLTVLSDACADNEPDVHRVLIEKVFPKQAQVMTADEWVKSL